MKNIFIINPAAGSLKNPDKFIKEISKICNMNNAEFECIVTEYKGHAESYVKNLPDTTPYRVYACGGDGTLNEVVNGAYGKSNIEVGAFPAGTGNDFVRNFSNLKKFSDIENQLCGSALTIDLLKYNDRFSINVCNIGLDSIVAHNVNTHKIKFLPRKLSYIYWLIDAFFHMPKTHMTVAVDDTISSDGSMILCAVGNGQYYGGGFNALSEASIRDGLIDMIAISGKVKRSDFLRLVGKYKNGTLLGTNIAEKFLEFRKCKKVYIESSAPLLMSVDGETAEYNSLKFEIIPNAIKFIIPKESGYNK